MASNTEKLSLAEERTNRRLNIKYRKTLECYILGGYSRRYFVLQRRAILMLQANLRRFHLRKMFSDLKSKTILIQRNWKKYYYDKQYNLQYTHTHFQLAREDGIEAETNQWKKVLYRDYTRSSKTREGGIDRSLDGSSPPARRLVFQSPGS